MPGRLALDGINRPGRGPIHGVAADHRCLRLHPSKAALGVDAVGEVPPINLGDAGAVNRAHAVLHAQHARGHSRGRRFLEIFTLKTSKGVHSHIPELRVASVREVTGVMECVKIPGSLGLVPDTEVVHVPPEVPANPQLARVAGSVRARLGLKVNHAVLDDVALPLAHQLGADPIHKQLTLAFLRDAQTNVVPFVAAVLRLAHCLTHVAVIVEEGSCGGLVVDRVADLQARVGPAELIRTFAFAAVRLEGENSHVPICARIASWVHPSGREESVLGGERGGDALRGHIRPIEIGNCVLHLDLVAALLGGGRVVPRVKALEAHGVHALRAYAGLEVKFLVELVSCSQRVRFATILLTLPVARGAVASPILPAGVRLRGEVDLVVRGGEGGERVGHLVENFPHLDAVGSNRIISGSQNA
mmetsp:Transcript_9738/g.20219  ORF Transcript_9738/g.20219 Transcript_9738/m.20219 type:complete len:417 (-) Transcript_9738:322-1572(-)